MKFLALLAAFATGALAQTIAIGYPTNGTSISAGTNTVEVDRPDTLTGSQEIAIVIAIVPCNADGSCPNPVDRLGTVLYTGSFDPEFPAFPAPRNVPQQNFTVTIPDSLSGEKALLSVVHFSLVGASPQPLFEIKDVTVNVE
ncbi:hypothetical protein OF83DRAFT_1120372 [Amylostereum chailletii]|nr:hypothetical protein OF83DRAFT_1120372 [Amylostereum chailletii]